MPNAMKRHMLLYFIFIVTFIVIVIYNLQSDFPFAAYSIAAVLLLMMIPFYYEDYVKYIKSSDEVIYKTERKKNCWIIILSSTFLFSNLITYGSNGPSLLFGFYGMCTVQLITSCIQLYRKRKKYEHATKG